MARIRENTEDFRTKAKDFESAAEAFARAGDDIAAAAMAMPSYDGQLSGPARKAGFEIQSQASRQVSHEDEMGVKSYLIEINQRVGLMKNQEKELKHNFIGG